MNWPGPRSAVQALPKHFYLRFFFDIYIYIYRFAEEIETQALHFPNSCSCRANFPLLCSLKMLASGLASHGISCCVAPIKILQLISGWVEPGSPSIHCWFELPLHCFVASMCKQTEAAINTAEQNTVKNWKMYLRCNLHTVYYLLL